MHGSVIPFQAYIMELCKLYDTAIRMTTDL